MSDINIKVNVISGAAQASVSGIAKEAKAADKNFKGLNLSIKNGSKFLSSFAGNLAAIGAAKVIGTISNGFSSLTSSVFQSTKALEVAATQFEVLTGSAGAANEIIRDLQEFTARTPFRFETVASAAQRLLAFGFTADEVKSNLQDLGDVAAASGSDIGELSLIYGQVAAAGKLTGERLLQLQERAVPIGPALANTLGVAESSVKDLVSAGAVDLATFEKAFQSLNEEGQFAFGGIDKASRTLQGRLSTLSDNFELFSASIGEQLSPALKAGATALTEFLQQLTNDQGFQNFLDNVAGAIPGAVRFLANTLVTGIEVFNAFRVTAGAIVGTLFLVASGALQAAEAVLTVASAAARFTGIDTTGIDSARASITALKDAAASTAADISQDNANINRSTEELTNTINNSADILINRYNEERIAAEATASAVVDANTKKLESERQVQTLAQAFAEQSKQRAALAREEEVAVNLAREEEDFAFLEESLGRKEAARVAAEASRLINQGKFDEASKKLLDARLKGEEAAAKNSIILDQKSQSAKVNIAQATASLITAISKDGSKAAFLISKGAAIAGSIVSGRLAQAQALATPPGPPATIPLAAQVGLAANINTAAIIATAIKGFQDGGIVGGSSFSGDNVLARVNSGEMILNRQQQAQLFNQSNGAGSSQSRGDVVVQIDGQEVFRAVSREVANGGVLGEGGV